MFCVAHVHKRISKVLQCARSNRDGNTVLGDVRESGITSLPLAGWKSKSLFIWSNDFDFIFSTVDSEMIIRLCNFSLEQGKNDLTTVINTYR